MYADFARVYDRLMASVDYEAWAEHYRAMLKLMGVGDGSFVLEAACGTGSLTLPLARFYQVLPSDASPEMLSVAALKAKAAGLNLTFLQQRLQALRSHKQADALVCACDGVNYLLTPTDLNAFLKAAGRVLKPGGVLAFDVSSRDKLKRVLGSQPQVLREEGICYIWENAWDEAGSRLSLSLSVFEKQQGGHYLRIDEEQTQRGWREEELRQALEEHGFHDIRFYANFTLNPPGDQAQRLHVCALNSL